jgi:hypothetical protein
VAETTKVFLAHVAQLGRETDFGAIHGAHLTGIHPQIHRFTRISRSPHSTGASK